MGTRSASKSVVDILRAFQECRTWRQVDLARHIGVEVRAVRRRLLELEDVGLLALSMDREHPHVYWSVRKGWFLDKVGQ
jgi:DNA-binding HxlR family transcriptional regulator